MRKCDKMGYNSRRLDIPSCVGIVEVLREFPHDSRNPFFVNDYSMPLRWRRSRKPKSISYRAFKGARGMTFGGGESSSNVVFRICGGGGGGGEYETSDGITKNDEKITPAPVVCDCSSDKKPSK